MSVEADAKRAIVDEILRLSKGTKIWVAAALAMSNAVDVLYRRRAQNARFLDGFDAAIYEAAYGDVLDAEMYMRRHGMLRVSTDLRVKWMLDQSAERE